MDKLTKALYADLLKARASGPAFNRLHCCGGAPTQKNAAPKVS
jgi:hypothetical protein